MEHFTPGVETVQLHDVGVALRQSNENVAALAVRSGVSTMHKLSVGTEVGLKQHLTLSTNTVDKPYSVTALLSARIEPYQYACRVVYMNPVGPIGNNQPLWRTAGNHKVYWQDRSNWRSIPTVCTPAFPQQRQRVFAPQFRRRKQLRRMRLPHTSSQTIRSGYYNSFPKRILSFWYLSTTDRSSDASRH